MRAVHQVVFKSFYTKLGAVILNVYPQEIARQLQEKETIKLERARQRRLERQLREEREQKILHEAISGLQDQTENHMNHHEQAETQRGLIDNVPSID